MNNSLLNLLHLTDSSLPIGSYSHSAGLETYVQSGIVNDADSAKKYIESMVSENLKYTDGAILSFAYDAALNNDLKKIIDLNDLCNAIKLPEEIRQASIKLGVRLSKIFIPFCNDELSIEFFDLIKNKNVKVHICVAFGFYAQRLSISKIDALTGFYYNACAGFINNCVKLIPLGQQMGQEILFSLHHMINTVAIESLEPDESMLGRSCPGFDIRCMQHESIYSRLYMS